MKSNFNEVEKVTVSILGNMKTLKLCSFKLGYAVRDIETVKNIFNRVLNSIEKNIGKGITEQQYNEFIENGKILSFWSMGICYEMKNGEINEYDGSNL